MQLTKKRKIYILCGMFALLAVTGYLNFTLNNRTSEVGGSRLSVIETMSQSRTSARAIEIAHLQGIVNGNFTPEQTAQANARLTEIFLGSEYEITVEHILKSHFDDAIVSSANGKVNVIIQTPEELSETQAGLVFDILVGNFKGDLLESYWAAELDSEDITVRTIRG